MNVGETFVKMALDDSSYKKGMAQAEKYTKKKATFLGNIFSGSFSVAAGIGIAKVFGLMKSSLSDLIMTAAQTETLNVAMLAVAHSTGQSRNAVEEQKRAIMDLGIAEQESSRITTRFMQAQLDLADASKIVRVAQDAGTIAGMNSSDAAMQMVEAIAKLRPELLSAFGMTRNLNDIYGDYARSVGKTTSKLTEIDKKQAMVNYIFKEGAKIAGSYEAAMGTFGKKLGSMEKLMLPKKLMQELKDALAAPLMLPVAGYVLDSIIDRLSAIKKWALDNKATLQLWGQTAVNVVSTIARGFTFVTNVFIKNWQAIKYTSVALLTYISLTKIAAAATTFFSTVSLTLNGSLVKQVPLFSWASRAIGIYRLQLHLASASGIVLTGVLARLRVAMYALWTSVGPLGWAILFISGAIAGGMALWNKYKKSLQKTGNIYDRMGPSTEATTEAFEEQTEALKEVSKAANKNLQSFDEVHQLQDDMAGTGEDLLDSLEDLELDAKPLGLDLSFDDLLQDIDTAKGSLSGFKTFLVDFWKESWVSWEETVQSWDWVDKFTNWIVDVGFDATTGKWSLKKVWTSWSDWVNSWGWVGKFSNWVVDTGFDATTGKWSMGKVWTSWSSWVRSWSWVNKFTNWIVDIGFDATTGKWNLFKVWGKFTDWVSSWDWVQKFSTWWNATMVDWWDNDVKPWFTIAEWVALYDNMLTSLQESWGKTKTWWDNTAFSKWWRESVAPWFTLDRWKKLFNTIPIEMKAAWNNVETWWNSSFLKKAYDWGRDLIQNLIDGVKGKIKDVKDAFTNVWETAKSALSGGSTSARAASGATSTYKTAMDKAFYEDHKEAINAIAKGRGVDLGVATDIYKANVHSFASGGITSGPMLAMVGDNPGGKEVISPIDTLADMLESAVYKAFVSAMKITQATSRSGAEGKTEVVLKLDNSVLARLQLPALSREAERQGFKLIPREV